MTSPSTATECHISKGPRWYRTRIRFWGAPLGLLIPGLLGILSYAMLQWSEARWSGAVGLVTAYLAAPTLLAIGAPFADRDIYPVTVAVGGLLWMAVGVLAARRATRNPMATFGDFWRHYLWMIGGIWLGVAIALVVSTVRIGSGIVDW